MQTNIYIVYFSPINSDTSTYIIIKHCLCKYITILKKSYIDKLPIFAKPMRTALIPPEAQAPQVYNFLWMLRLYLPCYFYLPSLECPVGNHCS